MVVGTQCQEIGGLKFLKGDPVPIPAPGKVTVIELWAKWCGPCRQIFPHLTDIYRQRKDKGLVVCGISIEDDPSLPAFVKNEGERMGYLVAVDTGGDASRLMSRAGVSGIPHAFVVDGAGLIVHSGHPGQPEFVSKVDEALKLLSPSEPKRALPLVTASREELAQMSIKELKAILAERAVTFADLNEKHELVDRIIERCRTVTCYA